MPKVELNSVRTMKTDPNEAAEELASALGGVEPKLVTLFASADRDQRALNKALRERLPKKTRLVGSTTGGEIDRTGMHQGSALLGVFTGDFEVGLGLGKDLSDDAVGAGNRAVAQACAELGVRSADLQPRRHVGMVIDDGSKMKKEELLLGMLESNQSLLLVGGGASDLNPNPTQQKPLLHVDGEVVDDAALLALFSTDAPFAALRSHWYEPSGQTLTITKVDDSHTRALEIDGKPAAGRYAEILGITPDELGLDKPAGIAVHPTALRVGREYFMRSPMAPLPDGSILFTNLVNENTTLELMNMIDMVDSTRNFFSRDLPGRLKSPTAGVFFHCGARTWLAAMAGKLPALGATFSGAPPFVGFNVNFEIYCGFQINTTLTALVFGASQ